MVRILIFHMRYSVTRSHLYKPRYIIYEKNIIRLLNLIVAMSYFLYDKYHSFEGRDLKAQQQHNHKHYQNGRYLTYKNAHLILYLQI